MIPIREERKAMRTICDRVKKDDWKPTSNGEGIQARLNFTIAARGGWPGCLDALEVAERRLTRRREQCVRLVQRFKVLREEWDAEIHEIEREAEHAVDKAEKRIAKLEAELKDRDTHAGDMSWEQATG